MIPAARLALPLLALGLLGPALPACAGDLPSVSIRFRDNSTVDGPGILLGDIARILAGEEKVVARLETLEVAKAAGFGLTRVIDTEDLFRRHLQPLAARLAIDAERKSIRVTTRSATLSPEALGKLVDAFLAGQERRAGETWKWELVRSPAAIRIPAGPHSLDLAFAGARRKGKVDLNLSIRNEGRTLRTLSLGINLRVEETVLVALKPIARDEILGPANAALQVRETTSLNGLALSDPESFLGRAAKAGIQPGRIITPRLVELPPIVRRGQEARLVYRNGDVNVTIGAICRQDGVPGQIITAKSLATQRLLRVRVTGDGLLEPVPGG